MDIYALNLFIEHSTQHWWEQNVFCWFTTPQVFRQSSAPGALSTLVTSVVLYSLTWATLMSLGKDKTLACGYNIMVYIYVCTYNGIMYIPSINIDRDISKNDTIMKSMVTFKWQPVRRSYLPAKFLDTNFAESTRNIFFKNSSKSYSLSDYQIPNVQISYQYTNFNRIFL